MSVDNTPPANRTTQVENKLDASVERFIAENPEKHKLAQKYGEFLMNSKFSNIDKMEIETRDIEGMEILFVKLMNDIKLYGLNIEDLHDYEIEAIKYKLGDAWKTIFENLYGESAESDEKSQSS